MKQLIRTGIRYVEQNLTCDVCDNPVEFSGLPEKMYLSHVDTRHDTHEPDIDIDGLLEEAKDALAEGRVEPVNEIIRAFVALDAMSLDETIGIDSYRKALRIVSEPD